jgi:AcrR family transcriptional regulator
MPSAPNPEKRRLRSSQRVQPVAEGREATRKRARTREFVLRAALECIAEDGIAAANAARIAQRCDLSWGVIQYHFGDRTGLFLALFGWAFDRFRNRIAQLELTGGSLQSRVEALVGGTWALMELPSYRALLEVELQLTRDAACTETPRKRATRMRRELRDAWRRALAECKPERVDRAQRLAITFLRGLALEHAIDGQRPEHAVERKALVAILVELLGDASPSPKTGLVRLDTHSSRP